MSAPSPGKDDNLFTDSSTHDAAPQSIDLIIRFASALPDLPLTLASPPQHTAVVALKLLVRKHLPPSARSSRLTLIHAGRVLRDNDAVALALRLPAAPPPPPPPPPPVTSTGPAKGKGRAHAQLRGDGAPLYVQCSLGAQLTAQELLDEEAGAAVAEQVLLREGLLGSVVSAAAGPGGSRTPLMASSSPGRSITSAGGQSSTAAYAAQQQRQRQQRQVLGFDRLLGSGWTADDVVSLRASFQAQLSYSHTPATMPTGETLRRLEERWLDSTGPGGSRAGLSETTAGDDGAAAMRAGAGIAEDDDDTTALLVQFDEDDAGALHDGLWGGMVGFFWPFAAVWRFREPGLWSERWHMTVLLGVMINLLFGFMRVVTSREDAF